VSGVRLLCGRKELRRRGVPQPSVEAAEGAARGPAMGNAPAILSPPPNYFMLFVPALLLDH